jgi:DNA gyrase subunit A
MEIGLVRKVDIDREMQQSYLDYAMSVIVSRALPDARDGLKPVQRRILYAMYDMGLRPGTPFKKSARIVGEVMGKYHPHGDQPVYEAMARQAQDFTYRNILVDGQGNFGSVDGDPPAAMRYTEARLKPYAMELISQIDRNTVDFTRNFDDTLDEPVVLPSAIPNLLVNGSSGIAVGMATNIPPHNLGEVVDALIFLLRSWERMDDVDVTDLMKFIQGPDFPTGGIILQEGEQNEILTAYATGRGKVIIRGRLHLEEIGRGKNRIIITELPYIVNKSSLIERIAELVRDGPLDGISDLRDESDRQGMRIVIELKQSAEPEAILRTLYQKTPLQSTFGMIMLALVGGEPRLLTLKQALKVYIEHRIEVVRRRGEYDLERARNRSHILEGLRIALQYLDEIISLIRNSPDVDVARERLIKKYKLSDLQATAILDMQLRRLAALERKKIDEEYRELQRLIKELEALLKSPGKMRQVVEDELLVCKQTYADRRRTQIVSLKGVSAKEVLTTSAMTPAKNIWLGITTNGLISKMREDELPRITGRDAPAFLLHASSHQTIYLVGRDGRAAAVAAEAIPETDAFSDGVPLYKVSAMEEGQPLAAVLAIPPVHEGTEAFIITISRGGMVKKTDCAELPGPSSQLFTLAKVNPADEIIGCDISTGKDGIFLLTQRGMAIRFNEDEVRSMGLVATGVSGIKLGAGDVVVSGQVLKQENDLIIFSIHGRMWRITTDEFPVQGRYGQGVIGCKLERGDRLVTSFAGNGKDVRVLSFEKSAARQLKLDEIPSGKRPYSGFIPPYIKLGEMIIGVVQVVDLVKNAIEEQKPARKPRTKPKVNLSGKANIVKAQKNGVLKIGVALTKPKKGGKTTEKTKTTPTMTAKKSIAVAKKVPGKKERQTDEKKPVPSREKTGTKTIKKPTKPQTQQLALPVDTIQTPKKRGRPAKTPPNKQLKK